MKVYEVLMGVKAGEKPSEVGICWMVQCHSPLLSDWHEHREEAYEAWSGFRGNYLYPVDGEDEFYDSDDLWANPKRHELLDHLIEWFKERDI